MTRPGLHGALDQLKKLAVYDVAAIPPPIIAALAEVAQAVEAQPKCPFCFVEPARTGRSHQPDCPLARLGRTLAGEKAA